MTSLTNLRAGRAWRWSKGGSYTIEVSHHTLGDDNLWCVYLSVDDKHPLVAGYDADPSVWADYLAPVPFHGGCTFAKVTTHENGKVLTLGCDFSHLHDIENACGPESIPHRVMATAVALNEYMCEEMSND